MSDLSSVAKDLLALAKRRENATLKALAAAIADLDLRISAALSGSEEWRFQQMGEAMGQVQQALEASGLVEIATKLESVAREFSSAVQSIPKVDFGADEANALHAATEARWMQWMDVVQEPAQWLKGALINAAVNPIPKDSLVLKMREYLTKDYQRHAGTYVQTAIKAELADTWQVTAKNLGFDSHEGGGLFQLQGPDDDRVSHPLCMNHLGEIHTLDEWESITSTDKKGDEVTGNGTGYPVASMGCGWNGRHILVPVLKAGGAAEDGGEG